MMNQLKETFTVDETHHGDRLDKVMAMLMPNYSRARLSQWIKNGNILKNNQTSNPKDKVFVDDVLLVDVVIDEQVDDFRHCQPQDIALDIIHQDDDIFVINKQAGLVMHPGAGNPDNTMVNALLYLDPALNVVPRAGIIHRLDKDTSGLLMVARNLEAHHLMVKQLQERSVKRTYRAIVHGIVYDEDTVDTGFGRSSKNRLKMAVSQADRRAVTHYRPIAHFDGFSLLEVTLETGRTHQIRVHLEHIGHPIVGCPLYGGQRFVSGVDKAHREAVQNFKRQALHAHKLAFTHPKTGKSLAFKSPIPMDMETLIDELTDTD